MRGTVVALAVIVAALICPVADIRIIILLVDSLFNP